MKIGEKRLDPDGPMYIIAELSGNHHQDLDTAKRMVREAAASGADAVKLQTYTPDTLTIDSDERWFRVGEGTLWTGRTLYDLYGEACTPWEWHGEIFDEARRCGVDCFSSPFDRTAVDFLEELDPPAYKIASFELVDLDLIEYTASQGRPMILSTGMATLEEIEAGVAAARRGGCEDLAILRCNSAYPAPPEEMGLRAIPDLAERFQVPVGLSDHTLGDEVALSARVLGACVLEKHFCLDRSKPGPDTAFSMEPAEWRAMVDRIRRVEASLGEPRYGPSEREKPSLAFRRSLFVVEDTAAGDELSRDNIRSIRPGHGLAPKELPRVLGRKAAHDLKRGTPLRWEDVL